MTTPLWCLLFIAIVPYVLAATGGYLRVKQLGSMDANHPRVQANELRGIAARAYGAQQNAWEALAFFGTAVIIAHLAGADPEASSRACVLFVVARVFHGVFYIADKAALRSGAFVVGLGCCFWLLRLAAVA